MSFGQPKKKERKREINITLEASWLVLLLAIGWMHDVRYERQKLRLVKILLKKGRKDALRKPNGNGGDWQYASAYLPVCRCDIQSPSKKNAGEVKIP